MYPMNKPISCCIYWRLLCWGLVCFMVFYPFSLYAVQAPLIQTKVPIIELQAQHSPPKKIGLKIGQYSKAIFPDIEYRYDTHLSKILTKTHFDYLLKHRLPILLKYVDQRYKDEMQGVMAAWSIIEINKLGDGFLSTDEYLLLNLLPNIGLAPNGSGFAAFKQASEDQYSIIGRNMDWKSTPELRSLQAITRYNYTDQAFVNIGFLGIVSVLTGFNQQGLFLSYFNAEPYSPYYKRIYSKSMNKKTQSTIFSLRKTLESSNNIKQATQLLSKLTFSQANNVLIADKNKVEVLEYAPNYQVKIRRWRSETHDNKPWKAKQQIAVIDCNVLSILPDNCTDSKDNLHWHRLAKLAQFDSQQPAQKRDISAILFDTYNDGNEIFNVQTLNSVIFMPKDNALYMYVAPIDAQQYTYPIHQAYLDVLPTNNSLRDYKKLTLLQILWPILFLLMLIVMWIAKIPAWFFKTK